MTITQEFADGEIRVVKETDEDGDGETTVRTTFRSIQEGGLDA